MAEAVTKGFHSMVYLTAHEPWALQVAPFRVGPRAYYVGNKWVGAYLIDCKEGLILIDTMTSETVYLLFEAIRTLGFAPEYSCSIRAPYAWSQWQWDRRMCLMSWGSKPRVRIASKSR